MKGSANSSSDAETADGQGRWLRIGLKPFSLLVVSHRAPTKNFLYVGSEADIAALDSKTFRALMTGLVGPDHKFANREAAVSEAWRVVAEELDKARNSTAHAPAERTPDRRAALKQEVETLRAALAAKTAELRALGGGSRSEGSATVAKIVGLLAAGASKTELIAASGAKRGYVDALLSRILPERGYAISATRAEGAKEKTYRAMKVRSSDHPGSADSEEGQGSTKKAEVHERNG